MQRFSSLLNDLERRSAIIHKTWLSSRCPAAGQCVQQVSSSSIFTGFACPTNVQQLESVSSSPIFTGRKCPANVRLLFAGLGCPAAAQCVQQASSKTISTHAGCVCALACLPTAHGCMPTGLKCAENLQTYVHGITFGGGVYYMLHTRSSVARFELNWWLAAWRS